MKKEVKLFKITPTLEKGVVKLTHEVVSKEVDYSLEDNQMLEFYYRQIGCDTIDVTNFGGYSNPMHFSATVDDEGLLKSGNVAMSYSIPIGNRKVVRELCGTVLIGRVAEIEGREHDGYFEIGLTDNDIEFLKKNIECEVLGVTR